ncbi:MAG: hypothetical protein LBG28_12775, partial [Tannerella sp.]|nr:hypothetical protein [Tannerella sp.]
PPPRSHHTHRGPPHPPAPPPRYFSGGGGNSACAQVIFGNCTFIPCVWGGIVFDKWTVFAGKRRPMAF